MKKKYLLILLVIIMFVPIIIEIINNISLKSINYKYLEEVISKKNSVIIYLDSNSSPVKDTLLENIKKFNQKAEVKIKYLDYETLDKNAKNKLSKLDNKISSGPDFIFIYNGEIVGLRHGAFSNDNLITLYNKYYSAEKEDIYYNIAGSTQEFFDQVEKNEITMTVFGAKNCSNCDLYIPVINDYAEKYNIKIYYFDYDNYDINEYTKLVLNGYSVPANSLVIEEKDKTKQKCTRSGEKSLLLNEYNQVPLTLFFKNGEPIDCISGYVNSEILNQVFKYHKIKKN